MNPDTKSREYHLRDTGPMANISGFMLQFTTKVSIICTIVLSGANIAHTEKKDKLKVGHIWGLFCGRGNNFAPVSHI